MKEKLSPNYEDYIEAIFIIQQEKKVIRVKDISQKMEVSMPSVNGAIKNLKLKGIVSHQKYGYVELTEKGEHIAREIFSRHKLIKNFLIKVLDLSDEIATEDACKLEHYLSKATLERLSQFIEFIESDHHRNGEFLKELLLFYQHGKENK